MFGQLLPRARPISDLRYVRQVRVSLFRLFFLIFFTHFQQLRAESHGLGKHIRTYQEQANDPVVQLSLWTEDNIGSCLATPPHLAILTQFPHPTVPPSPRISQQYGQIPALFFSTFSPRSLPLPPPLCHYCSLGRFRPVASLVPKVKPFVIYPFDFVLG